jgi:hypothetical protein
MTEGKGDNGAPAGGGYGARRAEGGELSKDHFDQDLIVQQLGFAHQLEVKIALAFNALGCISHGPIALGYQR